jgi:hypothetical protein
MPLKPFKIIWFTVHDRPTLINTFSIPKSLKQSQNIDKTTAFS